MRKKQFIKAPVAANLFLESLFDSNFLALSMSKSLEESLCNLKEYNILFIRSLVHQPIQQVLGI